MTSNAEIAKAMAENMTHAAVPLYGKKLRLPDRGAIIGIIKEFRRLLFPAYFGDAQLMALPPENYAALLLERIETALTAQVALALPEDQAFAAAALTHEILEQLPRIQQTLMTDIEATFDGDPAAADKEEIIFAYPGLFAIFVYRIAHELYLRQVPMIPRMMTEYAHSRTGIDIHPGAQIGPWFFIDHGTGIVIGETTVIGSHVKLYQGVTLGALSPRAGHASLPGKRHPTVCDYVTIYSGASILGGETVIGEPLGGGRQRVPHRVGGGQHAGGHHGAGDGIQKRGVTAQEGKGRLQGRPFMLPQRRHPAICIVFGAEFQRIDEYRGEKRRLSGMGAMYYNI